jgi:tRNA(Ile)-lysidine synthase
VLNRFQRYLRDECKILPGASLIAAVSGGADSLCLLELLVASGFQPIVAHFNHHLRPDAQADADFVAQQASKLGCRFVYGEDKVAELARSERLSIEAAARQARYKFLFAAAQAAGAEALVTGHNADDQVETVLLHFLRGSGLDGLNGMAARSRLPQFSADIDLVRPLLGFWRNEIDAFCKEKNLLPRQDQTNTDQTYLRNRLRHELIPLLATYNPQIKQNIRNLARITAGASQIVNYQMTVFQDAILLEKHADYVVLDRTAARQTGSPPLMEFALRQWSQQFCPQAEDFRSELFMLAAAALLSEKAVGQWDMGDNLVLTLAGDHAYLHRQSAQLLEDNWPAWLESVPGRLTFPGRLDLSRGYFLQASPVSDCDPYPQNIPSENDRVWVDADLLQNEFLTVRPFQPGERFQPLGAETSQKLSDFFNRKRISALAKKNWPLLWAGDQVLWVIGLGLAERYKITVQTKRRLEIRLLRS